MDLHDMDLPALLAVVKDLEAKYAAQATVPAPDVRPPVLGPERQALWRIAMLCKHALYNRSVPADMRPYFLAIAQMCREGVQRAPSQEV
jgi:hypothetical protein